MSIERFVEYDVPEHLCFTCKFATKCSRYKEIADTLQNYETYAFDKWNINLDISIVIDECDLYRIDFDLVQQLREISELGDGEGGELNE